MPIGVYTMKDLIRGAGKKFSSEVPVAINYPIPATGIPGVNCTLTGNPGSERYGIT